MKKRIGDVIGLAQSSANLSIAYLSMGNRHAASRWKKQTLDDVKLYGLKFLEVYLLRRYGTMLCEQGSMTLGIKLLGEAMVIAEDIEGAEFDRGLIEIAIKHYSPRASSSPTALGGP
jgi:hypothetical protein